LTNRHQKRGKWGARKPQKKASKKDDVGGVTGRGRSKKGGAMGAHKGTNQFGEPNEKRRGGTGGKAGRKRFPRRADTIKKIRHQKKKFNEGGEGGQVNQGWEKAPQKVRA